MLERKIYRNNAKKALMLTGARQVGKSYIVDAYAGKHYEHYVKVDFIEHPEYRAALQGTKSAEDILLRLTILFGDRMVSGKTIIFFDEVQECMEVITQIKYLVQAGITQ